MEKNFNLVFMVVLNLIIYIAVMIISGENILKQSIIGIEVLHHTSNRDYPSCYSPFRKGNREISGLIC